MDRTGLSTSTPRHSGGTRSPQIQPVTAGIAEGLGLKKAQGALVDEVKLGTPAAQAGLEAGDVITAVNPSSSTFSATVRPNRWRSC